MADVHSPGERSRNMASISGRDTAPEIAVRRLVRSLGVGYRLHARDLPGRPDLVFRGRRSVIFVHGCFWHRHDGCRFTSTPRPRSAFWSEKFRKNVERDQRNLRELEASQWKVLVIWECEIHNKEEMRNRITTFLGIGVIPVSVRARGVISRCR